MARCSGLSTPGVVDLPSKAANGLETGLGALGGCGACARASRARLGIAGLTAGAVADPALCDCSGVGRGVGRGIVCAKTGPERLAHNAATPNCWTLRVLKKAAIFSSASCLF